jgi:hypothetical protein
LREKATSFQVNNGIREQPVPDPIMAKRQQMLVRWPGQTEKLPLLGQRTDCAQRGARPAPGEAADIMVILVQRPASE